MRAWEDCGFGAPREGERERGSERLIPQPPATVTGRRVRNLQSFQIHAVHP